MKLSVYSLTLLTLLSAGATVYAETPDETRLKPKWQALDLNHDGKVTLDELPAQQAAMMKRMDLNGDGEISLEEFVQNDLDPAGAGRLPIPENVKIVSDLPYAGTNDPRQMLDVYLPKKASVNGPLPVVVYIHGGGWSSGHKIMARSQVFDLVDSGRYAAVSVGYRLSWEATWPAQIHDVKASIRWIRANASKYGFDPNRICALGPSAGGHLVAELGTTNGDPAEEGTEGNNLKQSSKVQCIIDMLGPVDLRSTAPSGAGDATAALLGGPPAEKPDLAADASPILHVNKTNPPFLIIHGTKDPVVNFQNAVELDKALRKAGVPVFFTAVEEGGHGIFGAATPEVSARIRAFLEHNFYDKTVEVATSPLHK